MKNIHILPTDKPSRIFITKKEGLGFDNQMLENIELDCQNQNLYITSDEEIKEGWEGHAYKEDVEGKIFKHFYTTNEWYKDAKKIILTTDQDLIKNGVQAIDDEFLEWFVKNPSCEFVEVKYVKTPDGIFYNQYNVPYGYYKIIIPKEETKQEILEEAAEKFRSENPGTMQGGNNTKILNAFKYGAKWQQERMYSEEEVVNILIKAYEDIGKRKIPNQVVLASWFKQFKKK